MIYYYFIWLFIFIISEDAKRAYNHIKEMHTNYLAILEEEKKENENKKSNENENENENVNEDGEKTVVNGEDEKNQNTKIIKDVILVEMVCIEF